MKERITVVIGGNYIKELDERLQKYGISHRQLAKEMGREESQVSRWFNKPDMSPSLKSIQRIEEAVAVLRTRKDRKSTK
jgi:transcriptional regulator with XRE-family HTH domain